MGKSKKVQKTVGKSKSRRFASVLSRVNIKTLGIASLAVVALAGVGASGYFYYQYSTAQKVLGTSINQFSDVKAVVEEVSQIMELPKEEPTVATVSDVSQLKSQPFFDRAQNGDRVLVYESTKKAILYRPDTRKIIDVAVINVDNPAPSPTATPGTEQAAVQPLKMVIWNGTSITGLTRKAEGIAKSIEKIEVVERANAFSQSYGKTIVVNLTGVDQARIDAIATSFQGSVDSLPASETAPVGDVLVILGSDFAPQQ